MQPNFSLQRCLNSYDAFPYTTEMKQILNTVFFRQNQASHHWLDRRLTQFSSLLLCMNLYFLGKPLIAQEKWPKLTWILKLVNIEEYTKFLNNHHNDFGLLCLIFNYECFTS